MQHYDIEFFWDPVCPFAWITSRWITKVSARTGYKVDWRSISLRLLNKEKDYATAFPPNYERGHWEKGSCMLQRARDRMGGLYTPRHTETSNLSPRMRCMRCVNP
jgi:predicted DsbA family dithiol-disulfide isomerase